MGFTTQKAAHSFDVCIDGVYYEDMATKARKRINITLPPETVELLDRIAPDNRSEFINQAVQMHSQRLFKARIRQQLKHAYVERAKQDLTLALEWEPLERELWELADTDANS